MIYFCRPKRRAQELFSPVVNIQSQESNFEGTGELMLEGKAAYSSKYLKERTSHRYYPTPRLTSHKSYKRLKR
jgi:hypothetical protein